MQNTNVIKQIKARCIVVFIGLCLLFVFIFIKVFTLSSFHTGSIARSIKIQNISRANIVDRNNIIIANNIPTVSSYFNPFEIAGYELDSFVDKLSSLFPEEIARINSEIKLGKKFIWIKRHMTPSQKDLLMKMGLPGIFLLDTEKRIYPNQNLFSHVVGVTNVDNDGMSGIEKYFNDRLTSSDENLVLSLDLKVQHAVRNELKKGIDEFSAIGGCAIVTDITNGEIISMVSLPDFDPNMIKKDDNIFNIATYGLYEPGSVAKIFNVAIGLETKTITLDTEFDITKPIKIGRFSIKDYKMREGYFSVADIFRFSSNIGSAHIAMEFGEDNQQKYFKKFGLLDRLNLESDEIRDPKYPNNWGKTSLITISFGHGIALTPMHIISVVSGILNSGEKYDPTFLKSNNTNYVRIVSKQTSNEIKKIMRSVVTDGSGKKANVEGYNVIGKTGTSEKNMGGKYKKKSNICFFIGSFSKYAVLVMLDEPKGTKSTFGFATASWNAAKIAGNIIERIGPILHVQTCY